MNILSGNSKMLAALTSDLSPHPAFFVLLVGLISYYLAQYFQSPWRRLPPGPKGLPLLGNALQLGDKLWLTFGVFRKTFGKSSNTSFGDLVLISHWQETSSTSMPRVSLLS